MSPDLNSTALRYAGGDRPPIARFVAADGAVLLTMLSLLAKSICFVSPACRKMWWTHGKVEERGLFHLLALDPVLAAVTHQQRVSARIGQTISVLQRGRPRS